MLDADVVVVAHSAANAERAREGGATLVDEIAQLAGVDGVVVAVPTVNHAAAIVAAIPLGVPMCVEKPLTADVGAAERISQVAGDRLFVMDKWRYHGGVQLIGELVRSGALGEVAGLRTVRVQPEPLHDDVDGTWILIPHDLAIAREVFGAYPTPEAAVGVHTMIDGQCRFESMFGILRFPDNTWHALDMSTAAASHTRTVEVFGHEGTARLSDGWDDHIQITRPDGTVERREASSVELPLLAELREFVDYLKGGPAPRSTAADGLIVVRAIDQLRRLAGAETP